MTTNESTSTARAVIVGAGIVGNSLAYHLARLGWRDLVLVDKGPMPNPGGSTGHASNFIFPVDYSKMMTELTADSTAQYKELGVFIESGGIEVARTEARSQELRRRMAAAKAWGIPCELLTSEGVQKLVPYLDPSVIREGLYFPTVGVVDSLRAGTLMRERAQEMGALEVRASTEVLGIDLTDDGERVRAVRTTSGDIDTSVVAVCCGVWSPKIAKLAGATIPLTPIVHQMISVGPIPLFADTVGEIVYPIVRDMDTNMYERQHGGDMEVGSYAHRPIIVNPEEIPSIEQSALSPTELPFTQDDFDPQLLEALELMPELLGDERVGVRYAINGLISMTPDGHPVLGETPEVKGLWSVAASWIKEGPGIARAVAEWMNGDVPEIDLHEADIARFYSHQRTRAHVTARAREGFNKMYGIVHPSEQWESLRPTRLSPVYDRERDLGAFFYETMGWERPYWYESNAGLLKNYAGRLMEREAEWESRWWSPIINAEHLALRDHCGLTDLSAFVVLDVTGPGALAVLQHLAVAQLDVPIGRVVYTSLLDEHGGFKSRPHDHAPRPRSLLRRDRRPHGHDRKEVVHRSLAERRLGAAVGPHVIVVDLRALGPKGARRLGDVHQRRRQPRRFPVRDLSNDRDRRHSGTGVAYLLHRRARLGAVRADRRGCEGVGRAVRRRSEHGLVPVGIGVYATTGRLEKGYRALGNELTGDFTIVEAGMARPTVKKQDFIGREAYLAQRDGTPVAHLCTLTVNDHRSSSGIARYMLGGEPIVTLDGERLVDDKGRPSYVTSAGSGPSLGKHILLAYLPASYAEVGRQLMVEYLGENYPVTVDVVGATPLFDPENSRVRS